MSYPRPYYPRAQGYRYNSYNSYRANNTQLARVASQAAARGASMALSNQPILARKAKKSKPSKKAHRQVIEKDMVVVPSSRKASASEEAKLDYPGLGRQLGSAVGSFIPLPGASAIGGWLGDVMHKGVKMITGYGSYHVDENTLVEGASPPEVYNKYRGKGTVIRHRDFIGDVVTAANAGDTKIDTYIVQPGLSSTFPWLSAQASSYQQYGMLGMVFEFKSTSGDALNSTNTALGKVVMATQYDVTEPVFQGVFQAENSEYAMSFKPSQSCLHPIECAREESFNKLLFTRNTAVGANEDPRLYDWCKMSIMTSGMQAASVKIGELWVTYEVLFLKPQIAAPIGNTVLTYHGLAPIAGTVTNAPFGGMTAAPGSTLRVYNPGGSTSLIALDRASGLVVGQKFLFTYYSRQTGTPFAVFPGNWVYAGCITDGNFWDSNSTTSRVQAPADGTTSAQYMTQFVFEITDLTYDPTISCTSSTLPYTNYDLVITQLPQQIQS